MKLSSTESTAGGIASAANKVQLQEATTTATSGGFGRVVGEGRAASETMALASTRKSVALVSLLMLLPLTLIDSAGGLRLTNMSAPLVADMRGDMDLDCRFDMGVEELYAVKWYKDDQEFFRYMPQQKPPTMSFPVAGVHLDLKVVDCSTDHCKVRLKRLTRDHSGGAYRCEISSEAPTFKLASETHNITVAALPIDPPRIEGITGPYSEGELISANCISDLADPAPILSWYINNQQVSSRFTGEMLSSEPDPSGLVARSLTLRYTMDRKLSQADAVELRCVAALPGVPQPPQAISRVIATKTIPPQVVSNQKLHWSFSDGSQHCAKIAHVLGAQLIVVLIIRWSLSTFVSGC